MFFKLYILLVSVFACFLTSCDGAKSKGPATNPTQRNGRSLSNVETKYVDQFPALSADALKLIYLSGKDDKVLRVRKASRSAGGGFSETSRLSSSTGLLTETEAALSPNGNYVLIQGTTTAGVALVLCNWAGDICTVVTTTPWGKGHFGFSPDSTAFYYLSGPSSAAATLYTADITSPTTPNRVGLATNWYTALWIPAASGYKIVALERTATDGAANVQLFTFASVGTATSATGTTVASNVSTASILRPSPLGGSNGAVASTALLVIQPVTPSAELVALEVGNIEYSATNVQRKIPLENQVTLYSLDGSASSKVSTSGYETVTAILTSDGNTIFSLDRVAGRCTGEDVLTYGTTISVTSISQKSTAPIYLKTPADLSLAPVSATGFCDRTVDGKTTSSEFGIYSLSANAAASTSTYTLAWSSDMTGDPEVFVMDVSGTTKTIWNVSQNRK